MLLKTVFREAYAERLISFDPTYNLKVNVGKEPKEKEPLTDEQVDTLLSAVKGMQVETVVLIALDAGLRCEEALALRWLDVHLDEKEPYLKVCQAWHIEHNRPFVTQKLKSKAAKRQIPLTRRLEKHLRQLRAMAVSEYVICNKDGGLLTGTQFRNLWKKISVRTVAKRQYKRYNNGEITVHVVDPELGTAAARNPGVVYSIDFKVTPHLLRHTFITNLIHLGIDPKTVQYLAGHGSMRMTMDIYAKVKYNHPKVLGPMLRTAYDRFYNAKIIEDEDLSENE